MLIAGFGAPGTGKSSVLSATAALLGAERYVEPEEPNWPAAVSDRELSGYITAIHYFRAERVPKLFAARAQADGGRLVLIDSIYDRLCHTYIADPAFAWLLPSSDRYFANFQELARIDYEKLPHPDILVFFEVSHQDWREMIKSRARKLDQDLENNIAMHAAMIKGAKQYALDFPRVKQLHFKNTFSTVETSAALLAAQLRPMVQKAK